MADTPTRLADSSPSAKVSAAERQTPLQTARPTFEVADLAELELSIGAALCSGELTQGPAVSAFETAFASLCGVSHAIAVSTGTAALELILRSLEVAGTEVIVPTNTFLATANAVAMAGARPVFADLQPETLCVGVDDVARVITAHTVGVVVVHIAGLICPQIDDIRRLCRSRGLFLLEDAAHAHGASWQGRRSGTLGDAAAFSFFPTKPMTTGEGGMITTHRSEIADAARIARSHGIDPISGLHVAWGTNYRMAEIPALLGLQQLRRLEEHLAQRRAIARTYTQELSLLEVIRPISPAQEEHHAYYKYPLLAADADSAGRLRVAFARAGVPIGSVYGTPCHLQPYAQTAYGARPGDCPQAEEVLPRVICLPIHASLSIDQARSISELIRREVRTLGLG